MTGGDIRVSTGSFVPIGPLQNPKVYWSGPWTFSLFPHSLHAMKSCSCPHLASAAADTEAMQSSDSSPPPQAVSRDLTRGRPRGRQSAVHQCTQLPHRDHQWWTPVSQYRVKGLTLEEILWTRPTCHMVGLTIHTRPWTLPPWIEAWLLAPEPTQLDAGGLSPTYRLSTVTNPIHHQASPRAVLHPLAHACQSQARERRNGVPSKKNFVQTNDHGLSSCSDRQLPPQPCFQTWGFTERCSGLGSKWAPLFFHGKSLFSVLDSHATNSKSRSGPGRNRNRNQPNLHAATANLDGQGSAGIGRDLASSTWHRGIGLVAENNSTPERDMVHCTTLAYYRRSSPLSSIQ